MKIPFISLEPSHNPLKADMLKAFEEVYDSNWFVLGDNLKEFETQYAAFNRVKFAIGTSNGLDALSLCLRAMNIGPGDEVIVPAHTFIATALAVSAVGATPVFVDICFDTYNLDPAKIEFAITCRTKAIVPVHLYGHPCEMDQIVSIAKEHQLAVIEDNAQAHGAIYKDQLTGTFGTVNSSSFYPSKNLGALGDGGIVTTNDEQIAKKVLKLRNYGSSQKYIHETLGYNMRLDELQAAFLKVKLPWISKWTKQRQQIAIWYNDYLKDIIEITLPVSRPNCIHVYSLFVITTKNRDQLKDFLEKNGIETGIHYPTPPYLQKAYENLGYNYSHFPVTDSTSKTCLSLPIWPGLRQEEIIFITNKIKDFYKK